MSFSTSFHRLRRLSRALIAPFIALSMALSVAHAAPNVVASIKPIHSLVIGVMGEPVGLLLTTDETPHDFHLKPSQMRMIANADVIFYVDDTFENSLRTPFQGTDATRIALSAAIANKIPYPRYTPNMPDAHDNHHGHAHHGHHDDDEHDGHDEHKAHDDHHDHAEHDDDHHGHHHHAGDDDLHIWLSAENAIAMTRLIVATLCDHNLEQCATYEANGEAQAAALAALHARIQAEMSATAWPQLWAFHHAYPYFEHDYGLPTIHVMQNEPHQALSARQISAMRKAIAPNACILLEAPLSKNWLIGLEDDKNVRLVEADPIGRDVPAGKAFYAIFLQQLADSIKTCAPLR